MEFYLEITVLFFLIIDQENMLKERTDIIWVDFTAFNFNRLPTGQKVCHKTLGEFVKMMSWSFRMNLFMWWSQDSVFLTKIQVVLMSHIL